MSPPRPRTRTSLTGTSSVLARARASDRSWTRDLPVQHARSPFLRPFSFLDAASAGILRGDRLPLTPRPPAADTIATTGRQSAGREMSFSFLLRTFGAGESRTEEGVEHDVTAVLSRARSVGACRGRARGPLDPRAVRHPGTRAPRRARRPRRAREVAHWVRQDARVRRPDRRAYDGS